MAVNFLFNTLGFLKPKPARQTTETSAVILPAGSHFFGVTYDGEQDIAAAPNAVVYDTDYYTMAARAYTLATINEFACTAISRITQFAIGTGLKLHPEPAKRYLKKRFKIDISDDFVADIQDLWNLFEDDKNVSADKENNIHGLANAIFYNAFIAGDVLVIKRVKNAHLEYQVVNGLSVKTTKAAAENKDHKIIDGVEVDEKGRHVAYCVMDENGTETWINARDSKGRLTAWLVYADNRRLGAVRGYSPLGSIMQKLHKINQYSNAEIIAANTNAKFAATIDQDDKSTGVNPLKNLPGMSRSLAKTLESAPAASANPGEVKAFTERLKRITSGLFIHMPKGQKLNSFDTKRPNVNYGEFVASSMKFSYASLGIPYEVALLVFQNNFSASRASLKMFEMILKYLRKHVIIDGFYQIVYKQFFELECLKGNINAPQFLALLNDEGYLDNAYTKAKFIGAQIPHIDETKEVNAVLSKLKGGLTTFEQALESLGNMTDFDSLIDKRKTEEEKIKTAGLDFETILNPEINITNDEGE